MVCPPPFCRCYSCSSLRRSKMPLRTSTGRADTGWEFIAICYFDISGMTDHSIDDTAWEQSVAGKLLSDRLIENCLMSPCMRPLFSDRHRADSVENNRTTHCLSTQARLYTKDPEDIRWHDVKVGP
jgi:hypothetical protein